MKKISVSLCLILAIPFCFLQSFFTLNTDVGKTKKIGDQEWSVTNLNVDKFRNGDAIPQAQSKEEWAQAEKNQKPAWCYYENDPANGEKYGKLYNWYAVKDSRGLAPKGWHIPSDVEWTKLTDYLGGAYRAGKKMKYTRGWKDNGNGTNESDFSGLPGGFRNFDGGFNYVGHDGYWWSSSEVNTIGAWFRTLGYRAGKVGRFNYLAENGFSVRCLRD